MSQARSQPKYIQIAESLAKAIQVGELNPGDRLASDDDLAVDFSASRNTVVRALVRLRDEGLIERIQGAGTYVAENSKRTGQRFLYVGDGHFDLDTRDTVFGRLEAAIDMILRAQYDSQLELDRPLADVVADHKTKAIDHAIEARFDGCFVMPIEGHTDAGRLNTGWLERLKEAGLGVVLIDQDIVPHPDRSPYDLVTLDHMHAGLTVGRHLASKNPRKVLLLAPAMVPHSVARRADGIAAALADRAECVTVNIAGKSEEQIEEAIRK
ncbi:MAG: GntR family transcriptional regulator, partial [Planctomycetota bacterium]